MDTDWEEVQSAVRAGIPIMIGDGEPVMRLVISAPGVEGQAEILLGQGQHIEIDSNPADGHINEIRPSLPAAISFAFWRSMVSERTKVRTQLEKSPGSAGTLRGTDRTKP